MKLINADYLTGKIFTEANLTNAHTCYDSIMAIIESMEPDDVLDKIRADIAQEYNRLSATRADETLELGECLGLKMSMKIIDKYKVNQAGTEGSEE